MTHPEFGTSICSIFSTGRDTAPWPKTIACFSTPETNIIIAVYVDDLLIVGASVAKIAKLKAQLSDKFHMSDLGPYRYYLGMAIARDRSNRTLSLSQKKYISRVLNQNSIMNYKSKELTSIVEGVPTPMETTNLGPPPKEFVASKESRLKYQSAVGSLVYAMMGTRPDIAYTVSVISRYTSSPDEAHWRAVKKNLPISSGYPVA